MTTRQHSMETSPRGLSRIGGLLFLIIILTGMFGGVVARNPLVAPQDASSTAANMLAMESLWRFSIAAELFMLAFCAVPLALIFFVILRPVSRDLALLVVFFSLVSIALEAANEFHLLRALFPLSSAEYLSGLEPEQLHAMVSLSVRSHGYGFAVSLIFFACECLVLGYLIFKSGYMPKAIGVLMQIAGLCYLANSLALLLAPGLAGQIFLILLLPVFVAESSLCLWMIVKGVNGDVWARRQRRSPEMSLAAA